VSSEFSFEDAGQKPDAWPEVMQSRSPGLDDHQDVLSQPRLDLDRINQSYLCLEKPIDNSIIVQFLTHSLMILFEASPLLNQCHPESVRIWTPVVPMHHERLP